MHRLVMCLMVPGGNLMKTRYLAILATLAFLFLFHTTTAHAGVTTVYRCSSGNCDPAVTVRTSASLQSGTLSGIGTETVLVESLSLQFSNSSLSQTVCQSPNEHPDCVNVVVPGAPPYVPGTLTAIFHDGVFAGFVSVFGGQTEIRPTNNRLGEGISLFHGLGGDALIHFPCCADQPIYVETSQVIDSDGDGVVDDDDLCPDTAPGDVVDATGCSCAQAVSDGGGIFAVQAANGDPPGCPANRPPVANDDLLAMFNRPTFINQSELLNNDHDPDKDTLTIKEVFEPVNVSVQKFDGVLMIIPDRNHFGKASFKYTVSDGKAVSEAMVNIEVLGRVECGPEDARPQPGFHLSRENRPIPGTPGKQICYKFSMSTIEKNGEFNISLIFFNQNQETLRFSICMMANARAPKTTHPIWTAEISDNKWTCKRGTDKKGNKSKQLGPSYHFGCREIVIEPGELNAWFRKGDFTDGDKALKDPGTKLSPYGDFLGKPRGISDDYLDESCKSEIQGRNQFLIPKDTVPRVAYSNQWSLMLPYEFPAPERAAPLPFSLEMAAPLPLSPEVGCTITWPVGNWFTMGNPDTYPAWLNGTMINLPTGSTMTLKFPPDSLEPERTFVVQANDPLDPTCLGRPLAISEPFVIPPEQAEISMSVVVPEECSALAEGSEFRFDGEAVADIGSPVFNSGEFIVGHSGACVVDNTPPQIEEFTVTALDDGFLDVLVFATDAITMPLGADLSFQVDGGAKQWISMDTDEPAIEEDVVFFRQIIGPFPSGSVIDLTAEVIDDVGNLVQTALSPTHFLLLDIKPGSDLNSINLKNKGVIPVAILTTDTFDATTVDHTTVEFGPNGAMEAHGRGHNEDADGDGDLDLVLHFPTQDTGITRDDREACLTGETSDGTFIQGCDSITIVGKGNKDQKAKKGKK